MRVLASLIALTSILDAVVADHPPNAITRAERRETHQNFNGPSTTRFLTNKTRQFAVDGEKLPELNFDPGESYAGLLPITGATNETRKYFFWFWPSLNQTGPKEVAIWFNGGPGCSSLIGLLTENGPFTWSDGTPKPVQNTYDWRNLTNVMWVEQPIGVGFTQGKPNITNEFELGEQFVSFYEQFAETFDIKGWNIYLTGESYAGFYLPYIGNAFIKKNSSDFPLKGVHINDPIVGDAIAQQAATIVPFAQYWQNMLGLNDTVMKNLTATHEKCGYKSFLDKYLTFPAPQERFPVLKNFFTSESNTLDPCDTLDRVAGEASIANPCFNIYHISDTCPKPGSVLGAIGSDYNPEPNKIFFNRSDVQELLHVPQGWAWEVCAHHPVFPNQTNLTSMYDADLSQPPAHNGVLQTVIEKLGRVIIGCGNLDILLNTNGTLLVLQNMTWNGWQGFKEFPGHSFFSPYHEDLPGSPSGAGYVGKWGHERGLTFYQIQLAGHTLPAGAPGASYSIMEVLLGRISPEDLGKERNFTTENGNG
ncbi:uncharacterized protein MYCFIDRAFT_37055 [Pseudocercospora fijiensis CIRAD86]|uniref:Carboxypeptidase n=1 Tax=Pseudocercospora fijiensis (strain CIRAD86) TaxID=383855 RepID=M3A230_PSEFD|nr:uncharacterized protein MYCFIDRAFT_37055 [Pseudocercospora fijiensis CIRAD86]EME78461.1 hypothetical protein MYCFIDRAFT_37055 [Pseudocercospora fijiensis CIRAD86]